MLGSVLLSHERLTLSSALNVFTAEFGMVSGGTHSLWPPSKNTVNITTTIKKIYLICIKYYYKHQLAVSESSRQYLCKSQDEKILYNPGLQQCCAPRNYNK